MKYFQDNLFNMLLLKEKRFLENFMSSLSGDREADLANFENDIKLYQYKNTRALKILGDKYITNSL